MEENKNGIPLSINGISNSSSFSRDIPYDDGGENGLKYRLSEHFKNVSKIILVSNKSNSNDFCTPLSKHKIIIERSSKEETLKLLEEIKKEIGKDVPVQETEPTAIILEIY